MDIRGKILFRDDLVIFSPIFEMLGIDEVNPLPISEEIARKQGGVRGDIGHEMDFFQEKGIRNLPPIKAVFVIKINATAKGDEILIIESRRQGGVFVRGIEIVQKARIIRKSVGVPGNRDAIRSGNATRNLDSVFIFLKDVILNKRKKSLLIR